MIYSIGNKRCQLFSQFSLRPKPLWDCWSGPTGQSSCVLLTWQSPARHGWDRSREIPGCCRELGAPRPHVLLLQHPPAQRGGRADGRAAQKSSHLLQANATPRAREGQASQGPWGGRRGTLPSLLGGMLPHTDRWTRAPQLLRLHAHRCLSHHSSQRKVQAKLWQTQVSRNTPMPDSY